MTRGIQPAADDELVSFAVVTGPVREGFTPHADIGDRLVKKVGDLREDYREVVGQILAMVRDSGETERSSGFKLDEVSVELGFDAKGKLGFVTGVEVGVSATVTLTFSNAG